MLGANYKMLLTNIKKLVTKYKIIVTRLFRRSVGHFTDRHFSSVARGRNFGFLTAVYFCKKLNNILLNWWFISSFIFLFYVRLIYPFYNLTLRSSFKYANHTISDIFILCMQLQHTCTWIGYLPMSRYMSLQIYR